MLTDDRAGAVSPSRKEGTSTLIRIEGTMRRGNVECPSVRTAATSKYLQRGQRGRMGQQLMACNGARVARGKTYRPQGQRM